MSLAVSCSESSPTDGSSDTHFRVVKGVVETADIVRFEDGTICTYDDFDLTIGEEYIFVVEVNGKCTVRSVVEIIR